MEQATERVTATQSKLTDEWGASLVIEHYTHEATGEHRFKIYMDNENGAVREWLEDHDEGIDIPYSTALRFFENFQ